MAEVPAAAAPAAGDTTAAPVVKEVATDAPAIMSDGAEIVPAAAAEDAADWRSAYGDDKEVQKLLARLAGPADVGKKLLNQEKKISSGAYRSPELPEGATDEEIAAYRKQIGVPEKPDGYGFAFPETMQANDADNAVLGDYAAFLHDRHIPASDPGAKAAFQFWTQRMEDGRKAQAAFDQDARQEAIDAMRSEWKGREYTRQTKIMEEFSQILAETPEEENALEMVWHARLPNGKKVGDFMPYLKMWNKLARDYAPDEALVAGDGAGGGKPAQEEYNDLIAESVRDPKKFNANQNKVARLDELSGLLYAPGERRRTRAA